MAAVLVALGVVARAWLLRQSIQGRAYTALVLLSIALYTYGTALYGACHGEVDFLRRPFACTRAHPVAFNPDAWRIGRAR